MRQTTARVSVAADPRLPGISLLRIQLAAGHRRVQLSDGLAVALTEAGAGRLRFRGAEYNATPDVGHLFGPHCLWTAEPTRSSWRLAVLVIDTRTFAQISEQICPNCEAVPLAARIAAHEVLAAIRGVIEAMTAQGRLSASLAAVCNLIVSLSRGTSKLDEPMGPGVVEQARKYLIEHGRSHIQLSDLAHHLSLPRFGMLRAFRNAIGVPPGAYAALLRVACAERLLRDGVPIAQAAQVAGFCDQSHLNRSFRRLVGVTPGQYRKACCSANRPAITLQTALAYRFRDGVPLLRRWTQLRAAIPSKTPCRESS